MTEARSISQLLLDFQGTLKAERTSVAQITDAFHERGFGVLLLIFALPMALPVPVPPGINIVLASPLLFLTAQQMVGRHKIWFPRWLNNREIQAKTLHGFLDKAVPFLQKLEVLTKPRLVFLTQSTTQKITGLLGLIMALTVCIPLPLTNTVPSFGIAVMALGVLMRDGLAVAVGAFIGTIWVGILGVAVVLFGTEGIDLVKEAIKSWM